MNVSEMSQRVFNFLAKGNLLRKLLLTTVCNLHCHLFFFFWAVRQGILSEAPLAQELCYFIYFFSFFFFLSLLKFFFNF